MKSFEIRKKFLDFFQKNQHKVRSGSDLILHNDPSLLFVNAGMNQFKNVFLGLESPPAKNVVTIQKCLRVGGKHNDLEEVGTTPLHHTFFEMLGNFSFGGYFKEKAIRLSWEFLTQELKIPEEYLWVTVHHKDKESYRIWRDQEKIPEHRIYKLGDKDNFWQMGETGPCGYCSEIHYYKGKNKSPDPSQLMEIWNLVFMEFQLQKDSSMEKLPVPCVDTGMGLERLCAVLQNKKSNYHTDLFAGIIQELETYCNFQYDFKETLPDKTQPDKTQPDKTQSEEIQKAFRVVADHSRAISLLIAESVQPGNQKEAYVLRRIIRRALYYSEKLQPKRNLLKEISLLEVGVKKTLALMETANKNLGESFKEYERHFDFLQDDKHIVTETVRREDGRFSNSLKEGEKRLEEFIQNQKREQASQNVKGKEKKSGKIIQTEKSKVENNRLKEKKLKIDKQTVWNLYSTYGFPMDLTRLMAKERGWDAPTEEEMKKYIQTKIINPRNQELIDTYIADQKKQMEEAHLDLPQTVQRNKNLIDKIGFKKFLSQQAIYPILKKKIKKTVFTGYETDQDSGRILFIGLLRVPKSIKPDKNTEQTPSFYSSELAEGSKDWLILDRTCFYPEGGGPIGDKGEIKTETGKAKVLDCQKIEDLLWLEVEVIEGDIKKDQECKMEVYKNFREGIKSHHTATHLLNSALRKVLGAHIKQAGSLVEPCFLRFDFTHHQALSQKQIQEIESAVLAVIKKAEPVQPSYKSLKKAKEENYIYLKGENYPEEVRVLNIGEDSSKELCGGIHVQNTKEIKSFKIIREEGIGSGVRRITAYTHESLISFEDFLVQQNLSLRNFLNSSYLKTTKSLSEKGLELSSSDFKNMKSGEVFLWEGSIKQENPFLKILEQIESEIKTIKQAIIKWEESETKTPSLLKNLVTQKKSKNFHPLAEQMLDLRRALNLTPPQFKEKFSQNPNFLEEDRAIPNLPIEFFKKKLTELEELKKQKENLQKEMIPKEAETKQTVKKYNLLDELKKQIKHFSIDKETNSYLIVSVPLEDRKILSDMSDFLLSKLDLSAVIIVGKSQEKHPLFINFNKKLSSVLSAGDILKNQLAPLCEGKGGGKAGFAQGSIKDRKKLLKLSADVIFKSSSMREIY